MFLIFTNFFPCYRNATKEIDDTPETEHKLKACLWNKLSTWVNSLIFVDSYSSSPGYQVQRAKEHPIVYERGGFKPTQNFLQPSPIAAF